MIKILADSRNNYTGDRITTFLVPIWKVLQAELRTHRSTGQSHYSSRAIPTDKLLKQVQENPFIPIWHEYQKGMAGSDTLSEDSKEKATMVWLNAMKSMVFHVKELEVIGISKEQRNRLLEPFMVGDCVVTASEYVWLNFFSLRCAEGVQPEFRELALKMRALYALSQPKPLNVGDWHIPFNDDIAVNLKDKLDVSSARCARTSYLNHEGKREIIKDIALCKKLMSSKHLTPFEHQLKAMRNSDLYAQYKGFCSYRYHLEMNIEVC
jgi:thymidylate synthase ThyX